MTISFDLIKKHNLPNSTIDNFWETFEKFKRLCLNDEFKRSFPDHFDKTITFDSIHQNILSKGNELSKTLIGDGKLVFDEFLRNIETDIEYFFPNNITESTFSTMPNEDDYGNLYTEEECEENIQHLINSDYFESLHSLFNFYNHVRGLYSGGVQ